MHPLLRLIASEPERLAEHAQAYAELFTMEVSSASSVWKRRAVLYALAGCGLLAAFVLAGAALMLWGVTPAAQVHAPWVLVTAPLLPFALALGCMVSARGGDGAAFEQVRRQVKADLLMLREAGAP